MQLASDFPLVGIKNNTVENSGYFSEIMRVRRGEILERDHKFGKYFGWLLEEKTMTIILRNTEYQNLLLYCCAGINTATKNQNVLRFL